MRFGAGIVFGALACAILAWSNERRQDEDTAVSTYLESAKQTAAWLDSVAVPTEHGLVWPSDPNDPATISRDLYSGSPGVILFMLEMHRATGEARYLDLAKRGADDLLATIPTEWNAEAAGLWVGVAGRGFTLHEVYNATRDERYRIGARRCVELLETNAIETPNGGAKWNDVTDILAGSAGIGLFLLYAAEEMDDAAALELAIRAGDGLIAQAIAVEEDDGARIGLKWAMSPDFPRLMPNFSHGTAGVCYFLATLHQQARAHGAVQDDRFLCAALEGAQYLTAIADSSNDGCVIFHHEPEGEDLFYLGWCHGPAGTSRLFHRLHEITGDEQWTEWMHRGARSIMQSGIPDKQTPGFWNNVGQCCGSAGVATFFLDLYRLDMNEDYKRFAVTVTDDLLQRATRVALEHGATGLKWIHAEHRVQPELLIAQTGYMQGAAGIGLLLLQLDAVENGRGFTLHLPDAP